MIKVMNIISDTNIGGAGRVLINYLTYRDRDKFDISVALPTGSLLEERITALGVRTIPVNGIRDKSFDAPAIKMLKKLIREQEPDVIHTHGSLSGRIAGIQCKKPVIYTRHSAFPPSARMTHGIGKMLHGFINNHYATRIIAVSPVCRDDLIKCGVDGSKIDVVLNGAEPVEPLSDDKRNALRQSLQIPPDKFTGAIIARIEDYKGHMCLIDAAKKLHDKGRDFLFLIAGTGSFEENVRKKIDALGLSENVRCLGFVEDVSSLLSVLDVQLNASFVEATSISLLEGMSIGLPAVVSDAGGNPYVIQDGVNGLVFKAGNSDAMCGCIERLMDSAKLRGELSKNSKDVFYKKFTGKVYAENIEKIYLKALEEAKHGKQ